MGLFGKETKPVTVTASGLADQLSAQLDRNAQKLEDRKSSALSAFRRTVIDLRHINTALEQDVKLANQMIVACEKRRTEAEQAIKDNENVCAGIIKIIGEVPASADEDEDNSESES